MFEAIRDTYSAIAARFSAARNQASHSSTPDAPRVVALDGLRGLMTIMVVVSHYFAELPHGIRGLSLAWIAVIMFFVLSGYLVGRLILEKMDRANFLTVFFVRRICRTLPVYIFCVIVVYAILLAFQDKPWAEVNILFPLWSYLTFFQNFFMVSTGNIGPHWLSPTWTLTVEEHFYLIAPAVFLFLPRRALIPVFVAALVAAIGYRYAVFGAQAFPRMAGFVLLPGVADGLICGLIAAILIKTDGIKWERYDLALRIGPIVMLLLTIGLRQWSGSKGVAFDMFSGLLVSIGCAMYILAIVRGSPEGKRLEHPFYCFFGNNSYSIYLTHVTILGLMHGAILGTAPDLATWQQFAVAVLALPVAAFIGWLFTQLVEVPFTTYGRSWKWSHERRAARSTAAELHPA